MPKSNLDWLGVVSLWIGAVVMTFKAADVPLMSGAPILLTAHFWNYVPLVLLTIYLASALYRQFHPANATVEINPSRLAQPSTQTQPVRRPTEAQKSLMK